MQKANEASGSGLPPRQLESLAMDRAPPRRNSMLQPLAQGRVQAEAAATPTRGRGWGSIAATGALPTASQQQKMAMVPHKYAVVDSQTACEGRGKRLSSPSTLVTSGRPSSSASVRADRNHKRMSTQSRKQSTAVFNGIKGANAGEEHANKHNNDSDSSDDDGHTPGVAEVRRRQQFFKDAVGPVVYEDGGLVTKGNVDHRGITPHVTFTSAQTPPSEAKNPLVKSSQPVTCGFCSSTNLLWVLRCSFCGSARMSDAPRLKYLIDMILSIDPTIKPEKLAKRILDYAKFDRVAMKAESTFKQAGLVRAKAAIMMMNRTILILRFQIMGMVFGAWKKLNVNSLQQDTNIQRVISIKEAQEKRNLQKNVFAVWKGYVSRVADERLQRFAMAYKRNEMTKMRRIWGAWQSFNRIRSKEKFEQMKQHYEEELNSTPLEAQKEIDRLRETQQETLKLMFTAGDTVLELLHLSLRNADHSVQKTLQLIQMYPTTAGAFYEASHGHELLDALGSGHAMPQTDGFGVDDEKDEEAMGTLLQETKDRIDRMPPSDSLVQWINFQRRRGADTGSAIEPSDPKATTNHSSGTAKPGVSSTSASPEKPLSANTRTGAKVRVKDKRKEFKPIKYLQELRAVIASPGVMLKLLCHTSAEAQAEYDRIRSTEAGSSASGATENSTTATMLSPSAQLQLKSYFKLGPRIMNLPPDIVSRDAFVLNDFDSLYAYVIYLYLFHSNYVAPGMELSPRYRLNYGFLTPQWQKVKTSLLENDCDLFAQQQFYIFLSKMKRINLQFLRFAEICKAVGQIAHRHEKAVTRETYNDFCRRVLGKDSSISVALEKETLASWVALPAAKILSLCENEDEFHQIEQVFKDNVLDLIKIFRIYGSAAGGKGILEQEFLKVMTKAGVTNKKNILRAHLQLIYQQSRQTNGGLLADGIGGGADGNAVGSATTEDEEEDVDDRGATPNEFFEALTRVAHHNYLKQRDSAGQMANLMAISGNGSMGNATGSSLLSCVVDLVVDKVVPLTKKFQEQGLTFKKQMIHPDVQHVCKSQEKKLKRVFNTYSQKNKNPQSRGKLLDLSDFEGLLKDRRLIDALFPHGKIKQLVAFVQQDGEIASTASSINGYDAESEFVFSEFVEALSAIAVYRNANPYLPFAKKLETFFEEYF